MKVQSCPSCGARYNVERLAENATFKCRRCGEHVRVETRADTAAADPAPAFSPGLLLAGLLMLGCLLLWANPDFGLFARHWPWELSSIQSGALRSIVALQAVAGLWAVLSALGILPGRRSVLTLALLGAAALLVTSHAASSLRVETPLPVLAACVALAAGLWLTTNGATARQGALLAFVGGATIVWWHAFRFITDVSLLRVMVDDLKRAFDGGLDLEPDGYVWRTIVRSWAFLLAGVIGVIAGFGTRSRFLAWTGTILLVAWLVLPSFMMLLDEMGADSAETWKAILARQGTAGLLVSGLALWWLSFMAVRDLVRHQKRSAG